MIDTVGTQTAGLSISIEGLGNDYFLHWSADCFGHEKAQDPYAFVPGQFHLILNVKFSLCFSSP